MRKFMRELRMALARALYFGRYEYTQTSISGASVAYPAQPQRVPGRLCKIPDMRP